MAKANVKLPSSFEEALEELEQIVQSMENDMLSLEDSLKAYERGVLLTKVCQEKLDAANQQIQVLQKNLLQPLNQADEEDNDDVDFNIWIPPPPSTAPAYPAPYSDSVTSLDTDDELPF